MLKFSKSGMLSFFKWISLLSIFSIVIAVCISIFLFSLYQVTDFRNQSSNLIFLLPFAGLFIGFLFYKKGKSISDGTNLLIDSFYNSEIKIPLKLAPFIFISTLITHLFGGSAGREGTALQISGAFTDFFLKKFNYTENEKKILIKAAVAGGFSAVFGTPLAAIFFAFEFFNVGKPNFRGFLSVIYVSVLSNFIAIKLGAQHVKYIVGVVPDFQIKYIFYLIFLGLIFGLCAYFFSKSSHLLKRFLQEKIPNLPIRGFLGGIVLVVFVMFVQTTDYLGLGIPIIENAFIQPATIEVFILKFIFTIITLSFGFKGGKVTPLFFIGATLGSFLSVFIPLPLGVLAAVGFVSVFAGATNTPIACFFMALELFGITILPYALITCSVAYFASGYSGIYTSQKITNFKIFSIKNYLGKKISDL